MQMSKIIRPSSRCRFIAHTADLSALIGINLTKWRWLLRRGEGGEEWRGGPLWSPAAGLLLRLMPLGDPCVALVSYTVKHTGPPCYHATYIPCNASSAG